MSTIIWPPIEPTSILAAEESNIARELAWLLSSLQETLHSLKSGLEDCAELLAPKEPGSTLVLSSQRSENLKGFITRVGTRIVKGDVNLRLPSLAIPRGQTSYKLRINSETAAGGGSTLVLEQLTLARRLIDAGLDVVDATKWFTGPEQQPSAEFISGQLRLLHENILEAKGALKGWTDNQKPWHEDPVPADAFTPPLPDNVSFHLSISEAAILLNVRTLESVFSPHSGTNTPLSFKSQSSGEAAHGQHAPPSSSSSSLAPHTYTGFSIRDRLTAVLGANRSQVFHDEAHETFTYKGQEVRVRDKVRVESQDPSLMAAFAKLGALERNVALWRRGLGVLMGVEEEGSEEEKAG